MPNIMSHLVVILGISYFILGKIYEGATGVDLGLYEADVESFKYAASALLGGAYSAFYYKLPQKLISGIGSIKPDDSVAKAEKRLRLVEIRGQLSIHNDEVGTAWINKILEGML